MTFFEKIEHQCWQQVVASFPPNFTKHTKCSGALRQGRKDSNLIVGPEVCTKLRNVFPSEFTSNCRDNKKLEAFPRLPFLLTKRLYLITYTEAWRLYFPNNNNNKNNSYYYDFDWHLHKYQERILEEVCDNHCDIPTPKCVQTYLIVLDTSLADLGQANPHP